MKTAGDPAIEPANMLAEIREILRFAEGNMRAAGTHSRLIHHPGTIQEVMACLDRLVEAEEVMRTVENGFPTLYQFIKGSQPLATAPKSETQAARIGRLLENVPPISAGGTGMSVEELLKALPDIRRPSLLAALSIMKGSGTAYRNDKDGRWHKKLPASGQAPAVAPAPAPRIHTPAPPIPPPPPAPAPKPAPAVSHAVRIEGPMLSDTLKKAMEETARKLKAPVPTIEDYELKRGVLERLSEIVDPSIAEVLGKVVDDLENVKRLAA